MSVYTIDENLCIECGQCRRFCPIAGAITIDDRYQHVIAADLCSGCGLCEAFCPVPGALVQQVAQPKSQLVALRRVAWRAQWRYHQHPIMGQVTVQARERLQTFNRSQRLAQAVG